MSVKNIVDIKDFNLTPRAKKALKVAQNFAADNNHTIFNSSHVFYGCIMTAPETFGNYRENRGVEIDINEVSDAILSYSKNKPSYFFSAKAVNTWHSEIKNCLEASKAFADNCNQEFLGVEHVLFGVLQNENVFLDYLVERDIDTEYLRQITQEWISGEAQTLLQDNPISFGESENIQSQMRHSILEKFAINLNIQFLNGELSPVFGRDNEIELVSRVLSKKNKSNVILTGEAGVGKTAIVEGLAAKIVNEEVPPYLQGYTIYGVDLASMIAGTKYRGDFEQRFKEFLNAAKETPNVILFFDEIHNIFGAGNSNNSFDVSNMLKPALARGEVKCIGATTTEEYHKIFEVDAAMKRRFEPIHIVEPSFEETISIVNNCLHIFEHFHSVKYSANVVNLIVELCESKLPHKKFPDKAFDIVDEVGALAKIRHGKVPIENMENQQCFIKLLEQHASSLDKEHTKDVISEYLDKIRILNKERENSYYKITANDVYEIMSHKAKCSIESMKKKKKFSFFSNEINKEVIGQNQIVEKIYNVLSCAKAGLNDPEKPLASFLFVGPTSVGKTYLAKKIAEHYFGNKSAYLQINMSELQDETAISKLIGSNAGYVGYEEGGMLTNFMRNNPNSVVLFDEIEKANPKILNLLLHILDEGYAQDNRHRKIDFSKSIVICTSNIGAQSQSKRSMGFISNEERDNLDNYQDAIKNSLSPELRARIGDILIFNSLNAEDLKKIVSLEIDVIKKRLKLSGKTLSIHKDFVETIVNEVVDNKLHAREIKDFVRQKLYSPLAEFILTNRNKNKFFVKCLDKKANIS